MTYGYIRVSSRDQNEDRQLTALRQVGVSKKNIYTDKQSGKDFNRAQYKKLSKILKKGDLLYIKSIDRLGRNYEEILQQWRVLTKEKGVDISVLDMPLLDTRGGDKDLTGTFIADLVLQILSYVAQMEREFIHQRQAEGIACAKRNGVKFGRRAATLPAEFQQAAKKYSDGELTVRAAAELCNMKYSTFYKKYREIYAQPRPENKTEEIF